MTVELCNFRWGDGWGGHQCERVAGHVGRHVCKCDMTGQFNEVTKVTEDGSDV